MDGKTDDQRLLVLRQPSSAWIWNLIWGFTLGPAGIASGLFAVDGTPWYTRVGLFFAGSGFLTLMLWQAWKNRHGRLTCDGNWLLYEGPGYSEQISLNSIAKIVLADVGQELKEFEQMGMSQREKARDLGMAPDLKKYRLFDAGGKKVFEFDADLGPESERILLIRRLEACCRSNDREKEPKERFSTPPEAVPTGE